MGFMLVVSAVEWSGVVLGVLLATAAAGIAAWCIRVLRTP